MLKAFQLSGLRTKHGLNVNDQPVLLLKAQLKRARLVSKIQELFQNSININVKGFPIERSENET